MSKHVCKKIFLLLITLLNVRVLHARTMLSRNDYYPLYTTMDPHAFLHTRTRDELHGRDWHADEVEPERFSFYLTPFGQNANIGKDFLCDCDEENGEWELGSLNAHWSMIGLLMGDIPDGNSYGDVLQLARKTLFNNTSDLTATTSLDIPQAIDCEKKFGFFQFPGCYKKRGLRMQLSAAITDDFGVIIEGGASAINFTITRNCENDLTSPITSGSCLEKVASESSGGLGHTGFTQDNVETYLMCKLTEIAKELNRDLCNFHKTSIEDIRVGFYWRRAFEVNEERVDWPRFLFIPFVALGVGAAAAKEADPLAPFALPHGNNGHNCFWIYGGNNIDFSETVEIGWELGFVHFFDSSFSKYPVPTSELQRGIFPFTSDVTISPGANWHFSLKTQARHFLDRLSFYFQWVVMEHKRDEILVRDCNKAFKPGILECRSPWKAQVINTALNYDISPNIAIGFAWQAPISQRNVFRSTTLAFGINFTF